MAGIPKESVVLGINDAKISPLITDDSLELSYETAIDVPGIQSLNMSPIFIEKQLPGDESILDIYSRLDKVEWSIEYGIISLDALAVFIGGKVTAAGETPAQTQTYKLNQKDLPGYFKMEAKTDYADVDDVHFMFYKCKCTSFEYTLEGEEYATISASGNAIPTRNNGDVLDIVFNETAQEIGSI